MIAFDPPRKSYAAYIFDCDGTLADTMPLHLRAWNHGLAAAGAPLRLDGRAFMSVAGMALAQTIEHWNETHSLKIDAEVVIAAKNRFFAENHHGVRPIGPVVAFARDCKAAGAPVAVASGGTRPDVLHTLDTIGLGNDFFDTVVTADEVERAKPAPDLFLEAARRLQTDPAGCLVLEDSPLGIEAATIAGMESVLLPNRLTELTADD